MKHGEEPRDSVGKEKTDGHSKQMRRKQPHRLLNLRMSHSGGGHPLRAEQIVRMPNRSQAPGGKGRQKNGEVVDLFPAHLYFGGCVRLRVSRLRQALLAALRVFRPARTVSQSQLRIAIDSCHSSMQGINVDGG